MIHFQPLIAALLLLFSLANGASVSYDEITAGDTIKIDGLEREAIHGNLSLSEDYLSRSDSEVISSVSRAVRRAVFSDGGNLNRFASPNIANTGARITYNAGNNNNGQNPFAVQATEATVRVTATSYAARLGSGPYNDGAPPGWNAMLAQVGNDRNRVHRGHLAPERLGGSGLDVRNIAAMYRIVNSRHLAIWERMVNAAFDSNLVPQPDCIDYRCIAYYNNPNRASPSHVRSTAWLIRPGQARQVWFDVTIPNEPNLPGTAATIHWDATATLFPSLNNRGRP